MEIPEISLLNKGEKKPLDYDEQKIAFLDLGYEVHKTAHSEEMRQIWIKRTR